MPRHLIGGLFVMVTLAIGAMPAPAADDEDARLTALFKDYLDEEFRQRPLEATRLGDHRFDHLLDDLSPKARASWLERYRKTLTDLPKKIDAKKLSRSGQIDLEIWHHDLTRSLWVLENANPYETDPRVYNDYVSDSIYLLWTQSTLPKSETLRNCVARMKLVPNIVAAAKESLKTPPKVLVEQAIRRNQGAIGFYQSGLFEVSGETAQFSELSAPAKTVVAALKDHQKFLEEELLPRATGDWRLGKEKFAKKLVLELNAGLTAEDVIRDAEAEAERVERDMYVIARQMWASCYPTQALPPDDADGRRETTRRVLAHLAKDHGQVEHLVRDVKGTVEKVRKFIAERDILKLPDPDRCQVIEMPEFQRGFSTAYLNPAPPLDPKAASVYAVSPPPKDWDTRRVQSYLEEYNTPMLKILTIHEAYPGHYVQLEYSNQHPSLIRRVLSSGVFAEGWAVYTEQMMLDQGYGNGDLSLRLHQLKFYLRAVINALLDYKMHCANMSDEEALELLMKRGFQSEGEAVGKVLRAKQSSCQLSTYFVGRMAFYRLRQKVEREMGDKFILGRYHEAVLSHGTLPVKYLPELVKPPGK